MPVPTRTGGGLRFAPRHSNSNVGTAWLRTQASGQAKRLVLSNLRHLPRLAALISAVSLVCALTAVGAGIDANMPPVPPHAGAGSVPSPVSSRPLPDLVLTGIAAFSGTQWAWLIVAEPGKPAMAFALRVGQKQGELELREIDFRAGTARVCWQGVEATLNFRTHSPQNESIRLLLESRQYAEGVRPFVEEHARAHALREKREQEQRARERAEFERTAAAAAADLAKETSKETSAAYHQEHP